jgi:hypothetical protein
VGGNRRTACCFANACWIGLDQHRVDPRHEGGRINKITTRDIVKLFEFEGDEWLFYKVAPVTVAFIRGTTADPMGTSPWRRSRSLSTISRWRWLPRTRTATARRTNAGPGADGGLDPTHSCSALASDCD